MVKNTALGAGGVAAAAGAAVGVLSELTVEEAELRDRGEYQCVATNAYGQDSLSVQLLVQGMPLDRNELVAHSNP